MDFTPELALALYNSEDEFPVGFDSAWVWIGYARKDNGVRALNHFCEGKDFRKAAESLQSEGFGGLNGSKPIKYWLSVDCFKCLGMMAKTDQGDKVREYFLEADRQRKQLLVEKSIRDLNVNTQVNVSNDPGAAFRPDYVERVRQFRLEIEKVRDSLMLTIPEVAYAAIEVIYRQFCVDFGIEPKPLTRIGLTTLPELATGAVEAEADSMQEKRSVVAVAVAEKPKYNLTARELHTAVALAIEGKERVYLQDLADEILHSRFSDLDGRGACSRLVNPLKRLGFKLESQHTQVNQFGETKCRSLYVRVQ